MTSAASAQESWVGKQILTARDGIRISHTDEQGNQVDVASLTEYRYVVLDDRDGWLQVKTYGVAIGWFEKKDAVLVDEAIDFFTERVRQNPSDWLAYNRRAGAWHYRGQLDAALPDYDETLRLNPNQVGMFNDRGMVWRKKNDLDKAIADFDQALRINPRNIVTYQNRADAWLAKGDNDKAITDCTEAIRLQPKYASAYHTRGVAWKNKNDLDRAMADYDQAILLDPAVAQFHHSRGVAFNAKRDWDQAIAAFTEALRLKPKHAVAHYERGVAYYSKKNYDQALLDCDAALRGDPNLAAAYYCRGLVWYAKKDYDRALAAENEAIRLNPKWVNAYISRGQTLHARKEYDRALADYDAALRLISQSSLARYHRALTLRAMRRYDEAIADINEAIRLDPKSSRSYQQRANIFRDMKHYDRAIEGYTEVIRLDPKAVGSISLRGLSRFYQGDYPGALQDFDAAERIDPNLGWANRDRARLLATCPDDRFRNGPEALAQIRRAQELLRDPDAEFFAVMAAVFAENGNFAEAVRWQERALEDPRWRDDADMLRRLESYRGQRPHRELATASSPLPLPPPIRVKTPGDALPPTPTPTAEVFGQVAQVAGEAVTIRVPAMVRIGAGDRFEIVDATDGVTQVATGEVAAMVGGLAMGRITSTTGQVAPGQKVRFLTGRVLLTPTETPASPPPAVPAPTQVPVPVGLSVVQTMRGHRGAAFMLAITPDDRQVLTTGIDGTLRTWDLATGKQVSEIQAHTNWSVGVAISPDGRQVVTSGNDRSVRLWDRATGQELRRFEGHGKNVWSVMFSRDGRQLLTGSHDLTVRLWDVNTGRELSRFTCGKSVWGASLSPDGARILSAENGGPPRLWHVKSGVELRSFEGSAVTVAFSPDGRRSLIGGLQGMLGLWDHDKGRRIFSLEGHTKTTRVIAFAPDGRRAATTGYDATVRLWDLETGTQVARYDWQPESGPGPAQGKDLLLFGVEFTRDGRSLVVAGGDGLVRVFRIPGPGVAAAAPSLYRPSDRVRMRPTEITGWGKVIDPDGDCAFNESGGKLIIKVPGSVHDLWPGQKDPAKQFNAPRVLSDVRGDFVATVKVTADWRPGNKIPTGNAHPYVGAGLLIWESQNQFIRLERNVWVNPTLGRISYTTPAHFLNGQRINQMKSSREEFYTGHSTWLRVKRTADKLLTSISHDGVRWIETASLTAALPERVSVGVEAISNSDREFVVEFDDFKVVSKRYDRPAGERLTTYGAP